MKFKLIKMACLWVAMLGLPVVGSSQEEAPIESHPGYLNIDSVLQGSERYLTSEVYLRNYILRMIARVTKKSEPDFAKMLAAIKLIRVVEFEFDAEGINSTLEKAESLVNHLQKSRWDTLVRSKQSDKTLQICIQSDREDHIYALAIVSWDSYKMTIVNVVGDIDLDMLSRLGSQFGIDELEDLEESEHDE
ncbi:MAG: DUF4252 domain-containing protein [Puniceicoccaceae bacterium]